MENKTQGVLVRFWATSHRKVIIKQMWSHEGAFQHVITHNYMWTHVAPETELNCVIEIKTHNRKN